MKKETDSIVFKPKKWFFPWLILYLTVGVILLLMWLLVGKHELVVGITIAVGVVLVLGVFLAISTRWYGDIVIENDSVSYLFTKTVEKRLRYFKEKLNIADIDDIRIVNKEELQKYDSEAKSRKSILFILKNNEYKYVAVSLFTTKQQEELLKVIESRRQAL